MFPLAFFTNVIKLSTNVVKCVSSLIFQSIVSVQSINNGALLVCTTPLYFFSISIVLRVVIVSEKAV